MVCILRFVALSFSFFPVKLEFTFNNGGQNVTMEWDSPYPFYLCDGKWHQVEVRKEGTIGRLTVDGMSTVMDMSTGRLSGVDAFAPLYFGGIPGEVVLLLPVLLKLIKSLPLFVWQMV